MPTLELAITASSDDAREASTGTPSLTDTTINLASSIPWGFLRFLNVTIPQGATILSASLSVNVFSGTFDDLDVIIWCEDTDDAATAVASANNISNRTRTTASTTVTETGLGVAFQEIADLVDEVQEVVDRAGWASGNDLAVLIQDQGTTNFRFTAWDGDPNLAATLTITYLDPTLIVNLENNNSDTTLYPRRPVQDNAGNNVTFDGSTGVIYEHYIVDGRLEATISGANEGDSCEVTVWFERY